MKSEPKTLNLRLDDLHDFEIWQLAQFLKRVSYDTCLQHTDQSADAVQAYTMITGLESIRRALAQNGYAPR